MDVARGAGRSDDYGQTWELQNGHRVLHSRVWCYIHVAADPKDPDTVWVLNTGLYNCVDGGEDWKFVDRPHGDHHDYW